MGQESEQLNDQSSVEFDDLRVVLKPFKRGFLSVVFLSTGAVVVRGFQRGGILRPLAADTDWIKGDFSSSVVFEVFEMREQGAARVDAELSFASAEAKRFDELMGRDGLLHGILCF